MYGFSTMVQRNWVRKMRGSEKWTAEPRDRGENNSIGNVMKEKNVRGIDAGLSGSV